MMTRLKTESRSRFQRCPKPAQSQAQTRFEAVCESNPCPAVSSGKPADALGGVAFGSHATPRLGSNGVAR